MRSAGTSGEGRLFAYLHDGCYQPKKKKATSETLNFGNVNFQSKAHCLMYVLAPLTQNWWDNNWTQRWFYHRSLSGDGLQSGGGPIQLTVTPEIMLTSREEALLDLLLNTTRRLSTRDHVEEFCMLRVWPLARGWNVELGDPKGDLPSFVVEDHEGLGLCIGSSAPPPYFIVFFC